MHGWYAFYVHVKVEALKQQCAKVTLLGAKWRAECEINWELFLQGYVVIHVYE